MTPKDKAEEMIRKFTTIVTIKTKIDSIPTNINDMVHIGSAKNLAIICVDEIIKVIPMYTGNLNLDWQYWQEVKNYLISK